MGEKTVVEIKGTKFEVDLSTAVKLEEFRVGDKVNVLKKEYSDYAVYPGVIVGFEWFKELPTITVAYLKVSYNEAEIKFLHYNEQSKEVEIAHSHSNEISVRPDDVIAKIDRKIHQKELEIEELEQKKYYFLQNFQVHFKKFKEEEVSESAKC